MHVLWFIRLNRFSGWGGHLEYPDEFNIPTFPAGSRIATTRLVGVLVMVVFFLIVCSCGILLWTQRSIQNYPVLVSVNNVTGQWEIVGNYGNQRGFVREISSTQSLQESVLGKFIRNWFWVSGKEAVNEVLWGKCDRVTECNPDNKAETDTRDCAIYCMSGDVLFDRFLQDVVPDYKNRVKLGQVLEPDMATLNMMPVGQITEMGGNWQFRVTVYINGTSAIDVLGYAQVARNTDVYPQTLGYFVEEFNVYKMN